ncbi:MAG TPA: condensation domain-containing protein, partial [Gemmatimonadaceae bacterium]|nr:condensation domain-containing protein [Gemmatimonadaceae bacterium]
MNDDRTSAIRRRVAALSDAQRGALAALLGRTAERGPAARLVAFLELEDMSSVTDDVLRAFLAERLPDHAIPSRFVALERLPRTDAGKLDRSALAHAVGTDLGTGASIDRSRTLPRTPLEEKIAAIWRDVLQVNDVGVDEDFFEIGGDSLLSIRVIARAGREGIRIAPERFFERPTIAHMAASAGARDLEVEQGRVPASFADSVGDAPLTPIQHWFLDAIPRHRDRWNQSYLLESGHALDAAQLEAVVRELVTHHDALRLRLTCRDGQWRQEFLPPADATPYRVVDLETVPESDYATRVADECEREHAGLRIDEGRLFRCVHFKGARGWCRILLVGHHLVLDGVSWSVILDDLAMLVAQAARGEQLRLPPRTASARAWAIALADLAATPAVTVSASHWLAMPAGEERIGELAGCHRDAGVVTLSLEPSDSRALMQEATRRSGTSAPVVLLAALLLAWRAWTGNETLRLDVEGHGRDVLGTRLDVSRTVGWFTTVFPIYLAMPQRADLGAGPSHDALVRAVHDAVEALPLHGAAHGLARYLTPDESLRAALEAQPRPTVLFNLLGTHDVTLPASSRLRVTDEPQGRPRSPDAPRPYLLELNARVERGALIVTIEYSRLAHDDETI